jgi:thiol-disulfide isomerase/thioredoxin
MKYTIAFLFIVLLCACEQRKPLLTGFEGKPLPSFNLLSHDSLTIINTKNTPSGKPVVLFYFSPQCPYCRAEMADIISNIASLKNIQFYVFTSWPFPAMKSFYAHYQLGKYPNISVGVDYDNFFLKKFMAFGVPYTAIYSKDRKLIHAYMGRVPGKQIKEVAED